METENNSKMRKVMRAIFRACCLRPCGRRVIDKEVLADNYEFDGKQLELRPCELNRIDKISEVDDQQNNDLFGSAKSQKEAETQRKLMSPPTGSKDTRLLVDPLDFRSKESVEED